MIRSMTGYGRGQQLLHGRSITVEIRSVNHRYFEFSCRTPRGCAFLEDRLKRTLQQAISRGKVEVSLTLQTVESRGGAVAVDHALAGQYLTALRALAAEYGLTDDLTLSTVARLPDLFTVCRGEEDEEELAADVLSVLQEALDRFVAMREAEGERLRADVLSRLFTLEEHLAFVEERSPQTVAEYRARLTAKLNELLGGAVADEARILTEAAIVADRLAVDEETVRLHSHIAQLRGILDCAEPVGRKLDFLVQEMNRETNTIGSKCSDTAIAGHVVEMKSEIEKIREQIQNIE
ncbi:MAG: YicC family protein [Angelakisella sp.]|nr:YicC family protein [Angelakisella sp.]